MNDFTKEELRIVKDALLYFVSSTSSLKIESINLRDKIQDMIDSYCETCGLCNRENCKDCPCR